MNLSDRLFVPSFTHRRFAAERLAGKRYRPIDSGGRRAPSSKREQCHVNS